MSKGQMNDLIKDHCVRSCRAISLDAYPILEFSDYVLHGMMAAIFSDCFDEWEANSRFIQF